MKMHSRMSQKDFERYAQAYGGAITRWPNEVHGAAQDFQRSDTHNAERILGAQNDLDEALRHAPVQGKNEALEARILRTFPEALQSNNAGSKWFDAGVPGALWRPSRTISVWGMALTLLLVCGFVGGYTGYSYALSRASSVEMLASAFGAEEPTLFAEELST